MKTQKETAPTKTILCYGDSLTWGYNPEDGTRYPYDVRWTGRLQRALGPGVRVVETGLNGRTVFAESWLLPNRSGKALLPPTLESQAPLDLVVLMLGINDTSPTLNLPARQIAGGCLGLIWTILNPAYGVGGKPPAVLLVAPPPLGTPTGLMKLFFAGAEPKSRELAALYAEVAKGAGCAFLDAGEHVQPSAADGCHLSAEGNAALARAMEAAVRPLLGEEASQRSP